MPCTPLFASFAAVLVPFAVKSFSPRLRVSVVKKFFRRKNKRHGAQAPCLTSSLLTFYFETAANKSDFISDWNCLSSLLKCMVSFELSESTVIASIAVFSTGEAFIFL